MEATMKQNQMLTCIAAAAIVAAILIVVGAPVVSLLPFALVLACPLMMIFMMRSMSGSEDHTGHGCEHDPIREAERPTRQER
jgi:Protein of unknown function (DUF2933)